MRSIWLGLGFGLAATLAVGVATTAVASAASFLSSVKEEKLLSEKVAKQIFTTEDGNIECNKETITGGNSSGTEVTLQFVKIKYEQCVVFNLFEPMVTVSEAEYRFLASGSVEIIKPIKAFSSINNCEVIFAKQLASTVSYSTSGHNIAVSPAVSGLQYTASASCTHSGSFSNGSFSGSSEWMIVNGLLIFMP